MGRSRLEASAVALREQQSMRQREASVAAALQIAEEHHQQQLAARQAARREAVGESTSILRTAAAEKQRLSSLLNERRSKLWALLDLERKEAETTLRKMQHNALLKEHDIMRRAGALKEKREKERTEQDNRLLALRRHREEENVRSQESTLRLLEVNAANDFQIDSKYRRQLDQKREDAVFEALWTEDLNAKRLRERRDIEAKLRKTEQIRKSLCEQITKRRQEREKALATLKLEKEQEACRLHKDLELAARHRSLQQAEAAKKRKEMDHALAQQLKERRQRQLEEAALERQQLAAQARLGLMAEERAFLMKTMENENAKHIRLLMEREKQKQLKELRELDYLYIQEQVTAEDRKELERVKAISERQQREKEVSAFLMKQMAERRILEAAEKALKTEEMKKAEAAVLQYRADLKCELIQRQKAMRAYREALDIQRAGLRGQTTTSPLHSGFRLR